MSLQYRIRDMSSDRDWRQRVRLSFCLIMEIVDSWCRQDGDFPVDQSVAGVLYIFSSRCDPWSIPEAGIQQHLLAVVDNPENEFRKAWPDRAESSCTELIAPLRQILGDAVIRWCSGSILTPTIESVNQQLVDMIVSQKFVVFHHYQTTSRDIGGFYSAG